MFEPFNNDHQSTQIGGLIFENQTDRVIIYGDIDITKSNSGLEDALKIQQIINNIVKQLQEPNPQTPSPHGVKQSSLKQHSTQQIEEQQDKPLQTSKKVGNPFS